jgi:hypothetical protein
VHPAPAVRADEPSNILREPKARRVIHLADHRQQVEKRSAARVAVVSHLGAALAGERLARRREAPEIGAMGAERSCRERFDRLVAGPQAMVMREDLTAHAVSRHDLHRGERVCSSAPQRAAVPAEPSKELHAPQWIMR